MWVFVRVGGWLGVLGGEGRGGTGFGRLSCSSGGCCSGPAAGSAVGGGAVLPGCLCVRAGTGPVRGGWGSGRGGREARGWDLSPDILELLVRPGRCQAESRQLGVRIRRLPAAERRVGRVQLFAATALSLHARKDANGLAKGFWTALGFSGLLVTPPLAGITGD